LRTLRGAIAHCATDFFAHPAKIAKIEDFARYVQPPQKPRGDFTTRRNFDAHPNKRLNCSTTR